MGKEVMSRKVHKIFLLYPFPLGHAQRGDIFVLLLLLFIDLMLQS